MIGFRTVRQGQRVAVWNTRGEVKYYDGPKLIFLFRETLDWLMQYSAAPGEYLSLRYKDGRRENLCGPVAVWFDRLVHESIEVKSCINVNANEAVVVYRREGDAVTRRVMRGPALFMPTAEEWLHKFVWHGSDPKHHDRKVPRALEFHKLWTIPDQMYFDVEDVRTADDALLKIKLMVFFELADVETMLDQTHDPVADFINAVSADVIDFVSGLTFEQFKEHTESLNDIVTYAQLVARGQRIGYRITKVVYRGYHANDALQAMHDSAIETRTQLKLEAETERQAQELEDLRLTRDAERAVQRRAMENDDADHKRQLQKLAHGETLREQLEETEAELDKKGRANAEQVAFLGRMSEMGIDLTRYLVAQYQNPDRLIRIDGGNGKGDGPQLHLHEN